MTIMTDRSWRRALLQAASEGNLTIRRDLIQLYRRFRRGEVVEYYPERLLPGTAVRITSRESSWHLYIGEVVAVRGQAGDLPVKVQLRDHGKVLQLDFEIWEVTPLSEE